jgi:hypothetical protein
MKNIFRIQLSKNSVVSKEHRKPFDTTSLQ